MGPPAAVSMLVLLAASSAPSRFLTRLLTQVAACVTAEVSAMLQSRWVCKTLGGFKLLAEASECSTLLNVAETI